MKYKLDSIKLFYNGLILEDSKKINSYDIENYDTIVVRGDPIQEKNSIKIIIVDINQEKEEVEVKDNDYVKDLKDKLKDRNRVNSSNVILNYNGEMLEDNEKIYSYDIENNSIIMYKGRFNEHLKNNNKTNYTPTPNEMSYTNEKKDNNKTNYTPTPNEMSYTYEKKDNYKYNKDHEEKRNKININYNLNKGYY